MISVIVTVTDNDKQYLKDAIRSLKSQLAAHEFILVENVRPLAKACNIGIQRSTGNYIVRLDADDWIEPELLEAEQQYLDDNPAIDCVWCDYLKTTPSDHPQVFHVEHYPQHKLEHACGAMYRRKVWEQLGGYDEDLSFQESYDFWCRFRRAGFKAHRLAIPMYYYRQRPGQMSKNPERNKVRKKLERRYA